MLPWRLCQHPQRSCLKSSERPLPKCQMGVETGDCRIGDVELKNPDCREGSQQELPLFVFSTAWYCVQPFLVRDAYLRRMESASRLLSPLYVKLDSLRTPCSSVSTVEGLACYTIRAPMH